MPSVWLNESVEAREEIDFLITMGGDGTICWSSKQFHTAYIPPIISFGEGSLGYMCNFDFSDFKKVIKGIHEHTSSVRCHYNLDTRFRLKTWVPDKPERLIFSGNNLKEGKKMMVDGFHILNEVLIDRGPFPCTVQLEIYLDD